MVTTVVAARPGEVQAVGFRFPLVGRLPYKGFFELDAAEAEAASLRAQGLDVCLVPVRAYSTLGWIDDPLTEPMLVGSDLDLSETLFHELVHATAHAASAADFNESVATFIGQEATYSFVATHGLADDPRTRGELAALQRQRIIESRLLATELLRFQAEVAKLYESGEPIDSERQALESAATRFVAPDPERPPKTRRSPEAQRRLPGIARDVRRRPDTARTGIPGTRQKPAPVRRAPSQDHGRSVGERGGIAHPVLLTFR